MITSGLAWPDVPDKKELFMTHSPVVASFWDAQTGSWQYVFHDPDTMKGAIVDPVWNFDPLSGATATRDAQKILDYVRQAGITVDWILDTHPHADHFSAAVWLKDRLGVKTGIGEHVRKVQALWKDIYNLGDEFNADGHQWDRLFRDGETFIVGSLPVRVMFSPGHTMASVTYIAGDAAFVHDTLMMPDSGTSRADFPGGSSAALYDSLQRILALPVIAEALHRGLPVLIGVNGLNLAAFLSFAGEEIEGLPTNSQAVASWCLAEVKQLRACPV
jgi:glyoxylase-like metal-dependent hydrolase (beta-lactamase superfamily II)